MAGLHVGIVFRLVGGLLALAFFLVLGSAVAVTSFQRLQQDFDDVAARQLPGLVAAGRLAQQSENLVAQAPSLIVSDTNLSRETVGLRVNDQAAWTGELINELRDIGASDVDLARLHGLKDDLVANLAALAAATQRVGAATHAGEGLNEQMGGWADDLGRLEDRLLTDLTATTERLVRAMDSESGGGRTTARDLARISAEALAVRRLTRLLRDAGVLVREALTSDRSAQLSQQRDRYLRKMTEAERQLPSLPATVVTALEPLRQKLARLGAEAFTARRDYLSANSAVRGLLARNSVISDKLVGAVTNITSTITREVQDTNHAVARSTQRRTLALYGVAGAGVLGALAILVYLKLAVLDRLRRLQGCLREQSPPSVLTGLCAGKDEIAEMARTLDHHMRVIGEREQELRQSEARYRTLYHRTPVMLHSADAAGRLIGVSDYWLECMGYSRDEVIGRRVLSFLTRDSRRRALIELAPTLSATGQIKSAEVRGRRRSGEEFEALLSAIVEYDDDGAFVQSLTVLTDITDRKRVEVELAERTEELQRSNAELEQFAYVASHDLREPLRMISSYVGLLQRRYADKLDGDAMEFIRFAADGATRMDRMVLDLLEYSRVGRKQLPLEPIATGDVVERVMLDLGVAVAESGGTVEISAPLPVVLADRQQLTRVFQNLIGNALKYRAPDRAPRIVIESGRSGTDWWFRIVDNGIGIAAEDCDRIFHLFQRLHARGEYDGTGLGLAIVKKIVERHGGRIWVESRPGEGSRFIFTLRAADPPLVETGVGARLPV
jgi:PAS domain S-box-containing protein